MSHWTQPEITRTLDRLVRLLSIDGVVAKRSTKLPNEGHTEYTLTDPSGLFIAGIRFLPSGSIGARMERGFYVEDSLARISHIAAAIAGKYPGRQGDMESFGFRRLESRGNMPF